MHLHDKVDVMRDQQMMQILQRQEETLALLKAQVAALGKGEERTS